MLLTTQYLDEADALADEISVIDHGTVIAHGTPHELKQIVGGQTLQVRPADPTGWTRWPRSCSPSPATSVESPSRGVLSVAVDGDAALTDGRPRLHSAGIAVTELALRLPSLDEVFFALTGRRATERRKENAHERR